MLEPTIATNESERAASELDSPGGRGAGQGLRNRPVLLATDFGAASDAAARVAAALVAARGAVPHAVHVYDTTTFAVPALVLPAIAAADELLGESAHESERRDVRERLASALGEAASAAVGESPRRSVDWPVRIAAGVPSGVIAAEARRIDAALVVMGLRRHARADRVLGDETTLGVMRDGAAPVLGVVTSLGHLPRRAVVGVDFGRGGARAARAALDVVDGAGTIVLAYASYSYPPTGRAEEEGERLVRDLGIAAACERAVAELGAPPGVSVEARVIEIGAGTTPADALLGLADEVGADLLAAGAHRAGRLERLFLGSVTADLVRDGRVSVLVVPPEPLEGRG